GAVEARWGRPVRIEPRPPGRSEGAQARRRPSRRPPASPQPRSPHRARSNLARHDRRTNPRPPENPLLIWIGSIGDRTVQGEMPAIRGGGEPRAKGLSPRIVLGVPESRLWKGMMTTERLALSAWACRSGLSSSHG